MGYIKKYYLRKVMITEERLEYWSSTAGAPKYIEQDGKKITDTLLNRTETISADFREATPEERAVWDELSTYRKSP